MDGIRIGHKIIWPQQIYRSIDKLLKLRGSGYSQQEAAERLGLDRSFISKIESLGELRKGRSVGAIGFPVSNKAAVEKLLKSAGVDFWILLTEKERQALVRDLSGVELLDHIMQLITKFRRFDTVLVMASDRRLKLIAALLEGEVVQLDLGASPLTHDQEVPLQELRTLLAGMGLVGSFECSEGKDEIVDEACS